MVRVAAGVVADGGADVVGQDLDRGEDVLDRAVGPLGAVERLVRIVDVGLVVLAVVDLHRTRVDVRLERVVGVGQVWKLERHLVLSSSSWTPTSDYAAMDVVLGCGNFGGIGSAPAFFGRGESREEAFAIMDAAWELGLRWFDTADAYGGGRSEQWIGEWLRATGNRPAGHVQDLQCDGGRRRLRARARPGAAPGGDEPRAARHRPDRHLPDARAGSGHAGRGDLRDVPGAARARVDRHLGRQQRRPGRPPRVARARHAAARPELVLAARPRRRGRGDPALRRARDRLPGVQPARRRLADREIPARRGAPRPAPG